ncbi:Pretoxin HINT domain-containing protein [Singulisphaera sp. GP187]|uniref:polymorphic toxin-type HINT domain-containing protein n=1 Tax=Singulisphaera sp. GP187 TaxID=1882752 RepID=UPI00092C9C02|nr:polymorphic toxin-type HINT domain-containing protein [Singulisphaera sp. GP187]SIO55936.1 Pretoxin HINT domain-containing protein [Singulisphaera sp. GP187]
MLSALLIGSALTLDANGPEKPDLAAYETAKANVRRDPDAHVRLALWCEAHGLQAERLKHLAIAVIANPRHSMARGLMGLVEYRGRWQRPETISEKARNDALLGEYRERRAKTKEDADSQWALALWCDAHDLKAEAVAHLTAVVKRDPKREDAWRRLGFKKQGQRWVTDARLAEEKAEAERQKQADRHWKPLLEKWRDGLGSKSAMRRAEVETALSEITDPRAVPMVWSVFATGSAERQAIAVRVLGQIDAKEASRALAMLAGFSDTSEVRRTATETLKRRDAREYADLLINLIRDPIKYQAQAVGGPGIPGTLLVEGKRKNVQRQYVPLPMPRLNIFQPDGMDLLTYDASGLPVIVRGTGYSGYIGPDGYFVKSRQGYAIGFNNAPIEAIGQGSGPTSSTGADIAKILLNTPDPAAAIKSIHNITPKTNPLNTPSMLSQNLILQGYSGGWNPAGNTIEIGRATLETQYAAASLQQQLESDVATLERSNTQTRELNERMTKLLNETTEQDLAADRTVWQGWWLDQLGYAQKQSYDQPKPTVVEVVSRPLPPVAGFEERENGYFRRRSCFGAGTPVHTLSGVQPIEALKEGDRVLTQNTKTGALDYQPILVVHHNPPSPTYRITLGDETVISSHFHRFWKAGQGWVMARDLTPGDTVRTLGGLVRVGSIDASDVQPVFNLDVAGDADFFVGRQGALVHDNTLPDLRQTPFDAPPSLATASPVSR